MNYRYFRSETGTSSGWRRKVQFGVKMNYRYYRWGPVLPVESDQKYR
jgi:hypothetical protein